MKNAPKLIYASGPCKYTRKRKTAPSTYATIIFRYVSALSSLLKIGAAIAFVYNRILDCGQDVSR